MLKKKLILVLMVLPLMSCGTNGKSDYDFVVCTGWAPIYIDKGDQITDATARLILEHNIYGQTLNCWE